MSDFYDHNIILWLEIALLISADSRNRNADWKPDNLLNIHFRDVIPKRVYMARFLPKDKLVS